MTTCTKYKVIELHDHLALSYAKHLEDWLNERCELGEDIVAVHGNKFIFKRNVYVKSIRQVESDENLPL